jgi:hypothetical protein
MTAMWRRSTHNAPGRDAASCGYALPGGWIQFSDSLGCSGTIQFCLLCARRGECEPAMVTLAVVKVMKSLNNSPPRSGEAHCGARRADRRAAASGVTTARLRRRAERAAEAEPLQSAAALQPQAPTRSLRTLERAPGCRCGADRRGRGGFWPGRLRRASPQGVIPAQEAAKEGGAIAIAMDQRADRNDQHSAVKKVMNRSSDARSPSAGFAQLQRHLRLTRWLSGPTPQSHNTGRCAQIPRGQRKFPRDSRLASYRPQCGRNDHALEVRCHQVAQFFRRYRLHWRVSADLAPAVRRGRGSV